ncbi:hypothetical protein N7520_007140 [Penicillium odoratum]|uniref:uncharacterized protein n=1 Tax=Penicillium odoratum TaxID=1167516 RepID=UPI002548DA26|nr:uncharacterized protein N7520_007140 [Penicillium odoratum]KAJ5759984.1 hypothetical protein N7520_007140 [Penicillium odoratum]
MENRAKRIWKRAHHFVSGPRYFGVSLRQPNESEVQLVTIHAPKPYSDADQVESAVSQGQEPHWIKGVYLCARLGAFVLFINVISICVAAGISKRYDGDGVWMNGSKVVFQGGCSSVKSWDTALHLIINALSTSILAASNYCMQSLVAPTREEVDASHAKGEWLDIGTASVRNLYKIGRLRVVLWIILLITATPFHVLYNSMIFESTGTNEFVVLVGPHDLTADNVMNLTTRVLNQCFKYAAEIDDSGVYVWSQFSSEVAAGNFTRLSLAQCKEITDDSNAAGTTALMVLVEELSVKDGGTQAVQFSASGGKPETALDTLFWENSTSPGVAKVDATTLYSNLTYDTAGDIQNFTCFDNAYDSIYHGYTAKDCIQISAEEKCQLLYSPAICIVVSLCALAKVIAMFFAARVGRSRSVPLLTLGDAVASFVTRPDPTTEGMCWLSRRDVSRGLWGRKKPKRWTFPRLWEIKDFRRDEFRDIVTQNKLADRKWYFQVPSKKRWAGTLFLCFFCLTISGLLMELAVWSSGGRVLSVNILSEWWSEGLGSSNYNLLNLDIDSMLGSVVVANTPQMMLTVCYYCFNNLVTDMLAAAEYSSYGTTRKPLRVSRPVKGSKQMSTYWLSIPYQYSVPMIFLHMLLHWLVSQSLFYVLVVPYGIGGYSDVGFEVSSLGYSAMPIFLAILVASLLVFLMILLGFKRLKSNMPLAGACSAAISAACHLPNGENIETAALGPVRWGQTMEPPNWVMCNLEDTVENDEGHCSFTGLDTVNPTLTKLYS